MAPVMNTTTPESPARTSNPMPKVLFVSYTADWTGPTNSLFLLLKYLRNRYTVAVLLPGKGLFSDALEGEGIPFFSLPRLTKWSIPSIYRLIRRERFDLVYGNTTHSSSRAAMAAAKLSGVRFVCHVREMSWGKSWRELGFLRLTDATIAVSEACSNSITRFVPRNRLHVVHNGVPISELGKQRESAQAYLRAEAGLSPDHVVIMSVGHICPRKGQEYAVAAFAMVIGEAPYLHLIMAGALDRDPSYVNKIECMIQDNGLSGRVSLLGFRRDISMLLRGSDLFVHTAISDPHPRSVIEAMEMELPVAAFAVDGVSETVTDRKTGYLAPMKDVSGLAQAIARLAKDPDLRQSMGKEARRRVESCFSAEAAAEKVAEIVNAQFPPVPAGNG